MKTLLAIIFLSALPTIAFAQNKNSIVFQDNGKPVPVADPCVYEDNGVYYLTGTTGTTDESTVSITTTLKTCAHGLTAAPFSGLVKTIRA